MSAKRPRDEDTGLFQAETQPDYIEELFIVDVHAVFDRDDELDWIRFVAPYFTIYSTPEAARCRLRTLFSNPTNEIKGMFHRTCTIVEFKDYLESLLEANKEETTARKLRPDELMRKNQRRKTREQHEAVVAHNKKLLELDKKTQVDTRGLHHSTRTQGDIQRGRAYADDKDYDEEYEAPDGRLHDVRKKTSGKQKVSGLTIPVAIDTNTLWKKHRDEQDDLRSTHPHLAPYNFLCWDTDDPKTRSLRLQSERPENRKRIFALLYTAREWWNRLINLSRRRAQTGTGLTKLATTRTNDSFSAAQSSFQLLVGCDGGPMPHGQQEMW